MRHLRNSLNGFAYKCPEKLKYYRKDKDIILIISISCSKILIYVIKYSSHSYVLITGQCNRKEDVRDILEIFQSWIGWSRSEVMFEVRDEMRVNYNLCNWKYFSFSSLPRPSPRVVSLIMWVEEGAGFVRWHLSSNGPMIIRHSNLRTFTETIFQRKYVDYSQKWGICQLISFSGFEGINIK